MHQVETHVRPINAFLIYALKRAIQRLPIPRYVDYRAHSEVRAFARYRATKRIINAAGEYSAWWPSSRSSLQDGRSTACGTGQVS